MAVEKETDLLRSGLAGPGGASPLRISLVTFGPGVSGVCYQVGGSFLGLSHPQKGSPAQGGDGHREMR